LIRLDHFFTHHYRQGISFPSLSFPFFADNVDPRLSLRMNTS
jgi:hypothetical protein